MKQQLSFRKVAAVTSSALLVAAFISYRGGAFDRFLAANPQPANFPSSRTADAPGDGPQDKTRPDSSESGSIASSGSGMAGSPSKTTEPRRTIMTSSKVIDAVFSVSQTPAVPSGTSTQQSPPTKPPAAMKKAPTLLPDSKTGVFNPARILP